MGKVRIIGGKHRSRLLSFTDEIVGLRPTPDKVKGILFNWLGQDLSDKICLDLFAGSGALGFEALSRQAKHVTFVEIQSKAVADLYHNQALLNLSNLTILKQNALVYLTQSQQCFDLIFLDPPYKSNLLMDSLNLIKQHQLLNPNGLIYIEYQTAMILNQYKLIKQGKAGLVNYALIQYA